MGIEEYRVGGGSRVRVRVIEWGGKQKNIEREGGNRVRVRVIKEEGRDRRIFGGLGIESG